LTILLSLGLGALFFHPPLRAQTATAGATLSFPLTFTEKGSSLSTVINLGGQEVKFRKEPDFGKDRIVRRALKVGPDKDDFIGIAADLTTHTLYLDLNQNLDLTDDPQGVTRETRAAQVRPPSSEMSGSICTRTESIAPICWTHSISMAVAPATWR
jgi:hypothetical protein